ncbi:uncharacterized protein [Mycetomoellerius zeteki]|uniref:uncharacterized protein n=1 Tax=Mycetomoellerius zeteki TaxID=64791 RepID=UPI00084E58D4|nr:PREDICTED: uncharacterized protein LOC108723888 [Trachymyrmex zeteki]
MRRKVTLKEVISVVKLSLFPIWSWPEPHNATKLKMFCVKLHHCLGIIVVISLQIPLMYGIINNLDEPTTLTKQVLMLSSVVHAMFNFIFHTVNYHHIQNVTFEMIQFYDLMKLHEEIVIQRYIDKCITFHGTSIFIFYWLTFTAIAVIPTLEHQPFPTSAEYPFDVSYQPLKAIIFIQQSIAGIMVAGQLCINVYMALLLWFTSHQPVLLIVQFFGMSIIGISEVFMYTWPAEHLMYMSKYVAETAFHMLENNHLIKMWKCLQIIIMRSQKPVTISIPCLLPILSLNYFTSYLSAILSYFTSLRVMMDDDNN